MPLPNVPTIELGDPRHGVAKPQHARPPQQAKSVGSFTFFLYLVYTSSYFLHLTARLKILGILHLDLITASLISISLFTQQASLKGRLQERSAKLLIILLGYIFLTLPFVEWPGSVIRGNFEIFLKGFVFFPFTVLIIDSEKRFKTFIFLFVVCQVFRVLEPLYLHLTTGYWGSATYMGGNEYADRLSGAPSDVVNPNGLAFVLVSAIPFLHYFLATRGTVYKLIYAGLLVALLYALVLTLSRGGLIALIVVLIGFFVQSRHRMLFILLAVAGSIFLVAHLTLTQQMRYMSLTNSNDPFHKTAMGRINGLKQNLSTALQRPIFGHGLGTSKEATFHETGDAQISHIMYLEAFIELGIGGLLIFLLFFKSIHDELQKVALMLRKSMADTGPGRFSAPFELHLCFALRVLFWMYIVFSLNYFGVSDYYWYLLGGMAVILSRQTRAKVNSAEPSVDMPQTSSTRSGTQPTYSQIGNRP